MSTNLIHGPFSLEICFLTMVSKAMSGVKRPLLHTDKKRQGEKTNYKNVTAGKKNTGIKIFNIFT